MQVHPVQPGYMMVPQQQQGMMMMPQQQPGMMVQQPGMMMQQQPQMMMQQQPQMMMQQQPQMMMQQQPQMMMQQQPQMMMQQQPQLMVQQVPQQPGMVMMQQPQQGMMVATQPTVMVVYAQPDTPWTPLDTCSMLLIDQEVSVAEAITGGLYEAKNRYKIYTNDRGLQYYALEESDCCARCICKPNHDLTIHFHSQNQFGPELFRMHKPFKCCCCAICPCFLKEATVTLMNGEVVAHLQQPFLGGCFSPEIQVYDKPGGELQYLITGPFCCIGGACCGTEFSVADNNAKKIASYQKAPMSSLADIARELFTDADKFTMSFDRNSGVRFKSSMIGALLFLDYLFFEDEGALTPNSIKCCNIYCCGSTIPCKLEQQN